jgi:hypothetical protein
MALRAKLYRIVDIETLATIWDYLNYMRTLLPSIDDYTNALEQDIGPNTISALDQRLRELKNYIVRDEKVEKSIKYLRIAIHISKRVALVELIGRYIEEMEARKAIPKKR